MSTYRGRAGPNFSEFLNNLNTISPPYDHEQFTGDDVNLEEDLAMFTNTDFTHFDMPPLPEPTAVNFDIEGEAKPHDNIQYEDLLAETVPYYPNYNHALHPVPAVGGFAPNPAQAATTLSSSNSPSATTPTGSSSAAAVAGTKRKAENINTSPTVSSPHAQLPVSVEESARLAAEEDKRRRNTAASARFRVKKKQREQALERTVKDVSDRNAALEAKVNQLEMENKWLKNLITEKNGSPTKEEFAEAYKQFRRESEEREEKETARPAVAGGEGRGKKGVGTV